MTMKVLFQNAPVDIDELIFAGETTVPSDRWMYGISKVIRFNSSLWGTIFILPEKGGRRLSAAPFSLWLGAVYLLFLPRLKKRSI